MFNKINSDNQDIRVRDVEKEAMVGKNQFKLDGDLLIKIAVVIILISGFMYSILRNDREMLKLILGKIAGS